jgi:P27 family predicted phage terminase small subunit
MTDDPAPPHAPSHLSEPSRRLWDQLVSEWDLQPEELALLVTGLDALDRGRQARRALRQHGLTYESKSGAPVARPEVAIEKQSQRIYAQVLRQLDLDDGDPPAIHRGPRVVRGGGRVARSKQP